MRALLVETDLLALPKRPERRWTDTFEAYEPAKAGTLDERLQEELSRDDGTPAWRAWVARAAQRRHIQPI